MFAVGALAAGLPTNTDITLENAKEYSVTLNQIESGSMETDLYQLEFPGQLGECPAGRVQTFLLKGEVQISGSSMDYKVGSSEPSALLHMPSSGYDMAVSLQYCCSPGLSPGCKKSLSIKSLRGFVAE